MMIYLSAPISHDVAGARARFDALEAYAREKWPEAEIYRPWFPGLSWETCIVLCAMELKARDMLLLHPAWRMSPGCRIEEALAMKWGKEVWEAEL